MSTLTRTRRPSTYVEQVEGIHRATCESCGWTEEHGTSREAVDAATLHKYGFRKVHGTVFGQIDRPDLTCPTVRKAA